MSDAAERLCFALDVPTADEALVWVERLKGDVGFMKIGLELFVGAGPGLVQEVRARGARVFLDLKLHDIPHTVAEAAHRAVALGVDLLTIHASGGASMMQAAAAAVAGTNTRLLAVTVLTSLDAADLERAGVPSTTQEQVLRLTRLASESGVHGVVCSPFEAAAVRRVAPSLLIVTPGIRGPQDALGDQKRALSAREAVAAGADVVVVGRPIRQAPDPCAVARGVVDEIRAGLQERAR